MERKLVAVMLVVCAALGLYLVSLTTGISKDIQKLEDSVVATIIEGLEDMQTISTVVTGQSGMTHTVSTTRKEKESEEDWKARHKEAIQMAESL